MKFTIQGDFKNNKIIEGLDDDNTIINLSVIKNKKNLLYKVENDSISGYLIFNYMKHYTSPLKNSVKVTFIGNDITNNTPISSTCYYLINNNVLEYDNNYTIYNKINIIDENQIEIKLNKTTTTINIQHIIKEYEIIDIPIGKYIARIYDEILESQSIIEINMDETFHTNMFKDDVIITKRGYKYGQLLGVGNNTLLEIYGFKINSDSNSENKPEFGLILLNKTIQKEILQNDFIKHIEFNKNDYNFNWFNNTKIIQLKDGGYLTEGEYEQLKLISYKNKTLDKDISDIFINLDRNLEHYEFENRTDYNINIYDNELYMKKFDKDKSNDFAKKPFIFSDDLFEKNDFNIEDLYYKITEDDILTKFEIANIQNGKYTIRMNQELNESVDEDEITIEVVAIMISFNGREQLQLIDNYGISRDFKLELFKSTNDVRNIFALHKLNGNKSIKYYDVIEYSEYDRNEMLNKFNEMLGIPPCPESTENECPACPESTESECPTCPACPESTENECPVCPTCPACPTCPEDNENDEDEDEDSGSGMSIKNLIIILISVLILIFLYKKFIHQ